jgi:hypothetical protein
MTTENKRFTVTQDFEEHHRQIRDNGHIIMGCFVEPQAEVIVNLLNELSEENERLKKENSIFQGKDAKHYQRWVNQIKKYVEEDNPDFTYDDDFIIKIALSYTLQSVRNGESLKRFQWEWKE